MSEFHINYRPRMAIKAQALADIVAEFTYDVTLEYEENLPKVETEGQNLDEDLAKWKLFVDGSSNQHGWSSKLLQASR